MADELPKEDGSAWELIRKIDEAIKEANRYFGPGNRTGVVIEVHGVLGLRVRATVASSAGVREVDRQVGWRELIDAIGNPLLEAVFRAKADLTAKPKQEKV